MAEKTPFVQTEQCRSLRDCVLCRTNQGFRDKIKADFDVPENFDARCPVLVTDSKGQVIGLIDDRKIPTELPQKTFVLPSSLVTLTVTGFTGNTPPNGTWSMQVPNTEGVVGGVFLVKLISADQGWNLEIYRRCCGGRLKLYATGKATGLGSTFDVIGDGEFKGQKGIGSVV